VIPFTGGANKPSDTLFPGKAGGTVAVRRTLVSTICRIVDPTQVPRPDVRVRRELVEAARLEVSSKAFCNAAGVAPAKEPIPRH